MKKFITMIMSIALMATILSGCGGSKDSASPSPTSTPPSTPSTGQQSPPADEAAESMFGVIKSLKDGQLEIELAEQPFISEEEANQSGSAVAIMQPDGSAKFLDPDKMSNPDMLGETKTIKLADDTEIIGFTGAAGTIDDLKEGAVVFVDTKEGDESTAETVQLMG